MKLLRKTPAALLLQPTAVTQAMADRRLSAPIKSMWASIPLLNPRVGALVHGALAAGAHQALFLRLDSYVYGRMTTTVKTLLSTHAVAVFIAGLKTPALQCEHLSFLRRQGLMPFLLSLYRF